MISKLIFKQLKTLKKKSLLSYNPFTNFKNFNKISSKQIGNSTSMSIDKNENINQTEEKPKDREEEKISMMFTLFDSRLGLLSDILIVLRKNNINLSFINSKPSKFTSMASKRVDVFVDIVRPKNELDLHNAIEELKTYVENFEMIEIDEVPWFPKFMSDINLIGKKTMVAGSEGLESDHPGFKDATYRARRNQIAEYSKNLIIGEEYPLLTYTEEETKLWNKIWDLLRPLHKKHACTEFNENFNTFINEINFRGKEIHKYAILIIFLITNRCYF